MEHATASVNQALLRGWRSSLSGSLLRTSLPALPAAAWAVNAEIAHAVSPVPMKSTRDAANLLQSYSKPDFQYSPGVRAMQAELVQNLLTVSRIGLPASVLLEAAAAAASSGATRTAPLWLSAILRSSSRTSTKVPDSDVLRLRECLLQCIAGSASCCSVDEAAATTVACIRLAAASGGNLSRDELQCLLRLCAGNQSSQRRRQAAWKGFLPLQAVLSPSAAAERASRLALLKQILVHGHSSGCINSADMPVLQVQAATMAVRLGAGASALDLLNLQGSPPVSPSVTLLNRLIDDEAGSASPDVQRYLQLMQQSGVQPTRDTLHALFRVQVHSRPSHHSAAACADLLQECVDAAGGLQPGERTLGYAAFHAAKHQQWEQVQRIRTMARAARKAAGRPTSVSRWESKLALFGRLQSKLDNS